jgi:hypothetical protein
VTDDPAVLGQPAVGIRARGENVIDDHRQDRHVVLPHRLGQGDVDRGVLQRRQPAREHRLGECADQVTPPRRDRGGPLLIRQAAGPVTFVEWVQASVEAVAKDDGASADGVGDGGVLALRVARHVHAPPERQRPRVERLGQRRLAGADDPGQHHVGRGDDAARVKHPRVVDERAARVEVLADEHAIGTETAFGDKRVRARQRRRRVLMPRQMEPTRRAQLRSARLAGSSVGRSWRAARHAPPQPSPSQRRARSFAAQRGAGPRLCGAACGASAAPSTAPPERRCAAVLDPRSQHQPPRLLDCRDLGRLEPRPVPLRRR